MMYKGNALYTMVINDVQGHYIVYKGNILCTCVIYDVQV